jgi:uncharacterized membrane protein
MRTFRTAACFAAWLFAFGLSLSPAGAAELHFLGDLPGGSEYSAAYGVSFDGTYVVGGSSSTASGTGSAEGFVWDQASGMIGIGDRPGGFFQSSAVAVSADGRFAAGSSSVLRGTAAVLWFRGPPATLSTIASMVVARGFSEVQATAMSSAGDVVVGWADSCSFNPDPKGEPICTAAAFRWTAEGGLVWFTADPEPFSITATALTPDGRTLAGIINGRELYLKVGSGPIVPRVIRDCLSSASGITGDGGTIVGSLGCFGSAYRWTAATNDFIVLRNDGVGIAGMSADGRVILDTAGGARVEGLQPIDLREVVAILAGRADFRNLTGAQFQATAVSGDGSTFVGSAQVDGVRKAWRVRLDLSDADGNGIADDLEQMRCGVHSNAILNKMAEGRDLFAELRESTGYGDLLPFYGRPWKPGTNRAPARDLTQPAEFLRAFLLLSGCPDGGAMESSGVAARFLEAIAFPAVRELHTYEMLLGNEAFADALDPTIGLDGIPPDDLGNQFSFKGVPGVQDLLDEELALLRGRELPGAPADWLNEAVYYPEYSGPGSEKRRAAVYHRLPPNAGGASSAAYRSNYRVASDFDAAAKFPQGHGDAYGHYLTALKTGLELLRDGPQALPAQHSALVIDVLTGSDGGLETVRRLTEAAAARARSASEVAELLFRRDYRENPEDPRRLEVFADRDPQRAGSMGDWARRGALGAYLDWAAAAHWAPEDPARSVHREDLGELEELAAAAGGLQERLDTAGAGLDPLGLVQNVVPFGIDASSLEPGTGRSHYEQVRDAANRALENARKTFEASNQAAQRMRDTDRTFEDFANRLEDIRADHGQQLTEIFGFPSPDDPQDNDLDGEVGEDFIESQSHPDLTNFLATDEILASQGMRPRPAPGQIQIALSELRIAGLRLAQAELALDELASQIRSQIERIEVITGVQAERVQIVSSACAGQISLTRRLEQIEKRKKRNGLISSFVGGVVATIATGDPKKMLDFASQFANVMAEHIFGKSENEFDVEVERIRLQCWKEAKLQGLEDLLVIDAEQRQLSALLRRSPQLIIDRSVAAELAGQALGRFRQAVKRGQIVLHEKLRLEARTRGQLLEERWKDMSFRIFRNAALKNYRAFFDIAARYVVLAARAYAYEFDARSAGDDALSGIYRERRLGGLSGVGGGLQGVLARLDGSVVVNNFNRPLETLGERSFSFRRNLLGIGVQDFPNDDLRFRAFLESRIAERVEDLNEIADMAQVSVQRDYGPGIVILFASEIDGRNFFGRGPELPFGNANFSITRNAKIRSYAVRFDGVDSALGIDPESGTVFVYLIPAGESVLREQTNRPRIEDEIATPWAVVDQFLPVPPLAQSSDFTRRTYNPWRAIAQSGGNFLNAIKRQRDSEAQIELGQRFRFNTNLAGRSAWNTRWLLVIPGGQWTSSSDPAVRRQKLIQFIYGTRANPAEHVGITDIRLVIQAYSH